MVNTFMFRLDKKIFSCNYFCENIIQRLITHMSTVIIFVLTVNIKTFYYY